MELGIPVMIIPKESSIFCAAGMLLSDLKHDFVRTYTTVLHEADPKKFRDLFGQMRKEGVESLNSEGIAKKQIDFAYFLDLRYIKQYHEVSVEITEDEMKKGDFDSMAASFHLKHNKLFGYSLEEEGTPIELINMRLVCIGRTKKPRFQIEEYDGADPSKAYKRARKVFLPVEKRFQEVEVFDGARLKYGNRVTGPAIIEQVHTTTFVTPEYNVEVDRYGSYVMYLKGKEKEYKIME
jgi:N-methylhydantoinase A